MKKIRFITAACAMAVILISAGAQAQTVKAGVLTCDVSGALGFVFGSTRDVNCIFQSSAGGVENYSGHISKFGVDIGYTGGGTMVWAVFAPASAPPSGALAGEYRGATASAAVGVGVGANALIGGFQNSFALQPVSLEGNTGLNVAAGIAGMRLQGAEQYMQPGPAAAAAANFVRTQLESGLSILNDRTVPEAERRARLRAFLASFMDIRRVALFSLGFARRSATPQQISEFVTVFRDYVIGYFESLLTTYYSGQRVRVTGSTQMGPHSYRVDLLLASPNAQNGRQGIDVYVRVAGENGQFVITDLAALGVWLSVHERDQVTEYLLETNGNFGGLLVHYRTLAERHRDQVSDATGPRT